MSYEFRKLYSDRYLIWDLLRETDPYYLNHHLFDTDMTAIETDIAARQASGRVIPSYIAYTLAAYARTLTDFPELNSYLRIYPFTRLAVYDGVDIAITIERIWNGRRIILLGLLRDAQKLTVDEIQEFLRRWRDEPLESLDEFTRYRSLLRVPAFCRWYLFQIFCKPFPTLMRQMVGTTAFTSIGRHGTTFTTPLSPRTCTLSLGRVEPRPRVSTDKTGEEMLSYGSVRAALSAWLTLTYDHRIIDGVDVARAGDTIRTRIERWSE
ncbi:MAG: 2-oxo acid dehydrogenase subunit E2 [Candidatus Riflebacteria bacterium]|nr:2-oxo acid dehydrogenase subunit E2 [Candidatus Riflebacteria bacterium]